MNCDFEDTDKNLMCTYQAKMIKKGYVMDFNYQWHKKHLFKGEPMLEDVDWLMLHHGKNCQEVMKKYDPEYYNKAKQEGWLS